MAYSQPRSGASGTSTRTQSAVVVIGSDDLVVVLSTGAQSSAIVIHLIQIVIERALVASRRSYIASHAFWITSHAEVGDRWIDKGTVRACGVAGGVREIFVVDGRSVGGVGAG